jgi:RNA polymerase sigma-70 factor (ECF subfamily)
MTELSPTPSAGSEPVPGAATVGEVASALENLSDPDLLRIKQIAKLRSASLTTYTGEDLLNEAIQRALDGSRVWPREVAFIAFLAQTMRSIASEERRGPYAGLIINESDMPVDRDGKATTLEDVAGHGMDPARVVQAQRALEDIEAMFSNDTEALHILHGLAIGSTPEEIQAASAMTPTKYASAQKRIRRELARRNPFRTADHE